MTNTSSPDGAMRAFPFSAKALAVIARAAAHAQCTPEDWLDSRLRACVGFEVGPATLRGWDTEVMPMLRAWALEGGELDDVALPPMGLLFHAMKRARIGESEQGLEMDTPAGPAGISGAQTHRLYDTTSLAAARARVTDREQLVHFDQLLKGGSDRVLPRMGQEHLHALENLLVRAPHLADATQTVLDALAVARRRHGRLRLPPILLDGPPGTGKTWWAHEVAAALGVPKVGISLPNVTASFVLSGSTPAWNQARPGRIIESFLAGDCASPLFILDELDKVTEGNYRPGPVLLELLEPQSASCWQDEFFACSFDVSEALFIATCNDASRIDSALRSRFMELRVRLPVPEELPALIQSAWQVQCGRYEGLELPQSLPDQTVAGMIAANLDLRMLARRFDRAIARAAAREGELRLLPADFGAPAAQLAAWR